MVISNHGNMHKLNVFQNHMMRTIPTDDRTPINELLKMTNQYPISSITKSNILKLFGHTK